MVPGPYHTKRLANGTQLVLAPLHETKAVTVLILYRIGSRYEPQSLNGCSHFIEHLMFKGTKKRPSTLLISKELDGVGAEYNAFTSKDHTGYYIKLAADELPLALDILEDMLYHSLFLQKEIDRERQVVIEEINMYEDNPTMQIDDIFEQAFYPNHPLGRSIAGPREVIRSVTRQRLLAFRDRFYLPSNMLVACAGRFESQAMQATLTKLFGRAPASRRAPRFSPFTRRALPLRLKVKHKETEQTHLMLGFPGYSYFHPDYYPLALLSLILGGTMSSRLFISIRERQGLCYMIRSGVTVYEDTGNVAIQAGLDTSRLKPALTAILREVERMRATPVRREELHRAKEYFRGKLVLELEDSESLANWVGKQQLLVGKIETPDAKLARINRVTIEDIQRVARAALRFDRMALALIGKEKEATAFRRMVSASIEQASNHRLR